MRDFIETEPDVELFVDVQGAGNPIVLVHGLFGVTEHWQFQIELLARQHAVVAYDLRGSGRSSKPTAHTYAITTHATDLNALLDAISVEEPAIIVGHSMGSCVALEFALTYPERVAGLCLVSGFSCGVHCVVNFDEMKEGVAKKRTLVELFQRVSFGSGFTRWNPNGSTLAAWAAEEAAKLPLDAVYASARGFTEYDARNRLSEIEAPALVIVGTEDWSCPLDPSSRFIADHIGGHSELIVLECGHFPMLEVPTQFNTAVATWLEANLAPDPLSLPSTET